MMGVEVILVECEQRWCGATGQQAIYWKVMDIVPSSEQRERDTSFSFSVEERGNRAPLIWPCARALSY